MGNLILAIDVAAGRLAELHRRLSGAAGPYAGMELQHASFPGALVAWSTTEAASVRSGPDGIDLVLGEPIDGSEVGPVSAGALGAMWQGATGDPSRTFDGYFAALSYRADSGATVGGDVLGLFPLYHSSLAGGSVHLVATSPAWITLHPLFESEVDVRGLAGILTTMHCVSGRTLLAGLRRLPAGRALVVQPGRPSSEAVQYDLPPHGGDVVDEDRQLSLLDDALEDSLRRQAPNAEPSGLLLSGGRDSRLLAGYARRSGLAVQALTIGRHDDLEYQCAAAVASKAGWRQDLVEVGPSEYPSLAERQVTWELLSGGMNNLLTWGLAPEPLQRPSTRLITGYLGDSIIGGSHMSWAHDPATGEYSYPPLFRRVNDWGLRPQTVADLLRVPDAKTIVEDVLAELRRAFEAHEGPEPWRAWCFDLAHRQRFHVAGDAWHLSFGFRPVLPVLDRKVLEAVARIPISALIGRRLQDRLLIRAFPDLARLPLDRNSLDTTSLLPSPYQRVRRHARWRLERTALGRLRGRLRVRERRFYYRVSDLDAPAWRGVRLAAESGRASLGQLLNADTLTRLVPTPDQSARPPGDSIIGGSGPKILLGLMLWASGKCRLG